jgi:hypothetical protein
LVAKQLEKEYSFDLLKLLPTLSGYEQNQNLSYTVKSVTNNQGVLSSSPQTTDILDGKLPIKVANVFNKDKTATIIIGITSDNHIIADGTITIKTIDSGTETNIDVVKQTYNITVKNGTASIAKSTAGEKVTITANKAASGKEFYKWSTSKGVTLENAKSSKTSFVMPEKEVTITVIYRDKKIENNSETDTSSDTTEISVNSANQVSKLLKTNALNKNINQKIKGASILSTEGTTISGWEEIIKEVENKVKEGLSDTKEKSNPEEALTMTIDLKEDTTLPKKLLETIKGKNINLILKLANGMTWTINGMSVTGDSLTDVDLNVTMGTNSIPEDVIEKLTKDKSGIQIELAHNGAFGFEATLSIGMEKTNAGQNAELYYYNEETKEFELLDSSQIGDDGNVNLTFKHASSYVIVTSQGAIEETKKEEDEANTATTTETADTTKESTVFNEKEEQDNSQLLYMILGIVAVIGIGGGVGYHYNKKKK